jgi:UDP-N-acetyl-D-glucosamine dehydrogenase
VAYKPDVSDVRESPALDVIGLLQEKGSRVGYFDPYVPIIDHDGLRLECAPDLDKAVRAADCVVVITNHAVIDYASVEEQAALVFDSRNAMPGGNPGKVVHL